MLLLLTNLPAGNSARPSRSHVGCCYPQKINNQKVTCEIESKPDRYKRKLGECFINNKSLSRLLVKNGYAFDYPRYSKKKYAKDQEYARTNKLGLWDMKFEFPWDFRKNN